MGKTALVALALASFTIFISSFVVQVEAVKLWDKVYFQPGVCSRVDGYAFFNKYDISKSCEMGYGKRSLVGHTCPAGTLENAYLKNKWSRDNLKGGICEKAVSPTFLGIPLPSFSIVASGRWDPNVGECASKCEGGVPQQAISCSANPSFNKVCSRAVCGNSVSIECDGKAPNAIFPDGGKCVVCQYKPPPYKPPLKSFDFTLSMSPTSAIVNKGNSAQASFSLENTQGIAVSVPLSCSVISSMAGRPTCSVSVSSCTPNNVCGGTMTVSTTSSTPDGTYTVRLSANGGINPPKTKDFSLTVRTSSTFNFIMTANPLNGGEVSPGAPSTSSIGVIRISGTEEPVRVSCQPLNFGVTCKLNGRAVSTSDYVECTPRPSCAVSLEVSSNIPGTYTVRLNGRGTNTASATSFVDYKFAVKGTSTVCGNGLCEAGETPSTCPADCASSSSGGGSSVTTGSYGFTLAVVPSEFEIIRGGSEAFTATVTKDLREARSCNVQFSILGKYDRNDLEELPPQDLTVTLGQSSCSLGPDNPTCSVQGTVRTTGNTPISQYDRYYVVAKCTVGADRERNEQLRISVVPYATSISVSPSSGSVLPGGQTSATVTFYRQTNAGDSVPIYCSGLPAGASCNFASTIPEILKDDFGFSRDSVPTDSYGWIKNAKETNAYVQNYGQGGRYDRYMQIIGAPHTAAKVSKSVIIPPLQGRKLFISFDYRLETGWDCTTYTYLTGVPTCNYQVYSDGSVRLPSLQGIFRASGNSFFSTDLASQIGSITATETYRSCSSGRFGGETCDVYYELLDQSGSDVGNLIMYGVIIKPAWLYWYPWVFSRGSIDTGWKTYTAEITGLVSPTQPTVLDMSFQNKRWGTRYDDHFTKYHFTSIDNVRIYSDQPFSGCNDFRYAFVPSLQSFMYSCSTPVTITTQDSTDPGTYDLTFGGNDGINWFVPDRYGNIYYDYVTAYRQKFMDLSKTTTYQLTVQDNTPPTVSVTHSPSSPKDSEMVTFTANAADTIGLSNIDIFVDGQNVKTCSVSGLNAVCQITAGPYSAGTHTYYARAIDTNALSAQTDTRSMDVQVTTVCGNNVCETGETQANCALDCKTTVLLSSPSLAANEKVVVTVTFTDSRYKANGDVRLDLLIKSKQFASEQIVWDASNGCELGGVRMSKDGSAGTKVWPVTTVSQDGFFSTTFECTVPSEILGGDKTLVVTPTIY